MEKREGKAKGHISRALDTELITVPYLVCHFSLQITLHLKVDELNFCHQRNQSLGCYGNSVRIHAKSRQNFGLKLLPGVDETRFS